MRHLKTVFATLISCMIAGGGCAQKTESPSITPGTGTSAVEPDVVCVEQLRTAVTLRGDGFTPMPSKTLESKQELILPAIKLARTTDVDGAPATGDVTIPDPVPPPTDPAAVHVRWQSGQQMSFDVYPELALKPGLYDVTVTNPDGVQSGRFPGGFVGVPRPVLTGIAPSVACDAQGDDAFTLTGTGFLSAGSALPKITVGDKTFDAKSVESCKNLPGAHAAGKVQTCTTATFVVPKGTFAPGKYPIVVTNPEKASCASTDKLELVIVPPPSVTTIEPDLVCDAQAEQAMTVTGKDFLQIDKALPTVKVGAQVYPAKSVDGCVALDPPVQGSFTEGAVSVCKTIKFAIPKASLPAGSYHVEVTNPQPADCHTEDKLSLRVQPPPSLASIEPDLVCDAQADQPMTITGKDFLKVGATLPTVKVGTQTYPASALDGCTPLPAPEQGSYKEGEVSACTTLKFSLTKGSLAAGTYDVVVTNPVPADCRSEEKLTLRIEPAPTVKEVVPDVACHDQGDRAMLVNGTGFLQVGSQLPDILVGTDKFVPTGADGCTPVPGNFKEGAVLTCKTLKFTIPKGTPPLPEGDYVVVVVNPKPADCKSEEKPSLHVAPPPKIAKLSTAGICVSQGDATVTVEGTKFLRIDGVAPAVTLSGAPVPPAQVAPGGCTEIAKGLVKEKLEECTQLVLTVKAGTLPAATYDVVVTNPDPAGCKSTEAVKLVVEDPPTVTGVVPSTVCSGGSKLTINGSGFIPTPTITLKSPNQADVTATGTSVSGDGKQITTNIGAGAVVGNTYEVIVKNPDGCEDRPLPHKTVTVVPGPFVFYVDPEVVYNGVNTRVTVYATGLTLPLPANAVEIVPTGQAAPVTQLVWNPVPGKPNRIQAVVPKGQAPGDYDLRVMDSTSCQSTLVKALKVTNSLTIALDKIVPPFGWTQSETAVTIFRDTTKPTPPNEKFVATPRAFLNPANPQANDIAIPLESVSQVDDATLTAVVPKAQPVKTYDLIVVNPTGAVGLLANAFKVQTDAPPTIDAVTPSSIIGTTGQIVKVAGKNFVSSTISLSCVDANGAPVAAPQVASGAVSCDAQKNCTQTATVNGTGLPVGAVCVLRLTNADGSYAEYSAIGVTNSSLNLTQPKAGPDMTVGRRALVAAAVDATPAARFVYAIGGDGGQAQAGTPFSSVESVAVDLYGKFKTWKPQKYGLGTGRSFAGGTRVGRYVYVAGGSDGTTSLATGKRAMVLNPREAPLLDVDDIVPANAGLAPGYWLYKVSATFAGSDPDNPGGESLPADEFIVKVPAYPGKKIQVVLKWTAPVDSLGVALPNVNGYRVYRTPTVNGASGGEVLLTTTAGNVLTYTDDGSANPGTDAPLPLGSTGQWADLPAMGTARRGHGAAAAFDPTDPTKFYVYSLLGLNAAGAAVGTYEYLPVTTSANGHQTVNGPWKPGAQSSPTGRWQVAAWVADASVSTLIGATDTYVYVGGGVLANGNTSATTVEAGKVTAGGDLGAISDVPNDFKLKLAGYGVCAANGQLFAFGGAQAAPSPKAKSALIVAPAPTLATNAWNDEGLTMTHGRYLMGSSVQSAFIFLLGGETDEPSPASKSTELVIW